MTVPRPRGMSDSAFEEWAARLVIVGEEAFLPEELFLSNTAPDNRPIKPCHRCGRLYVRPYSDHVDEFHNDGPRTAYWREQYRERKRLREYRERMSA